MNELDEAERHIIQVIKMMQEDYMRQVKPYVDELVKIRSLRIHSQVFVVDSIEHRYVGVDGVRLPGLEAKS